MWLLHDNHQIKQSDRSVILLSMFKQALYAKSEDAFESCYNELLNDVNLMTMQSRTLKSCMMIAKDFAHCYHSNLLLRGTQTNNFVESQFLVVKDIILKRTTE